LNHLDLQFRILGRAVRVRCVDLRFRRLIFLNYEVFKESLESADLDYHVERNASGGFYISQGGETVANEASDEATEYTLIYLLEKFITIDLENLRTDLYFVHSSAIERGGRAIMIVAESGVGKSTTTWALLQHGFRYLSDELAPIDPVTLAVEPYPHALCLKTLPPEPYVLPEGTFSTERTRHVPVSDLPSPAIMQPTPLQALLFLERGVRTAKPTFSEISSAEASARLYGNTLNALAHSGNGLNVAIKIASTVPAFRLSTANLQATCKLISGLEKNL
jgi:hypothetical protein